MVLIMQHKNHLGILWGRSTEEGVGFDRPQFSHGEHGVKCCCSEPGNGSGFEQGINFGYRAAKLSSNLLEVINNAVLWVPSSGTH